MTREAAKDYLGHPCRFTEAKEYFAESFTDAKQNELREIRRNVGRLLLELSNRISHSHNACRAISVLTSPIPDADEPHSMMEILAGYELDTSNLFWRFAGMVLAATDTDTEIATE